MDRLDVKQNPDAMNFAYCTANAYERWDGGEREVGSVVFNNVTYQDIERFARRIAYTVAANLYRGAKMDPESDPLGNLFDDAPDWNKKLVPVDDE